MNSSLIIRKATIDDIDFISEAIIEADKSSTKTVSTCKIFALTENNYKIILQDILVQDIEYYDYYLSGFLIAELNGEYIGTCGSWLEGGNETPSGMTKTTMLLSHLDKSSASLIKNNLQIIKNLTLTRETGALQLEYVYIREKYRGQGFFAKIVSESIKWNFTKYNFSKVQSILLKGNYNSYFAFLKFGYIIVAEKKVDDPKILDFYPFNTKILMEYNEDKVKQLLL